MRRPVFLLLAAALAIASVSLAFVPTGGGSTYVGERSVGGGECGSSYVKSLEYRRWTASVTETVACLPETGPRTAWALLAGWATAAAVSAAVLRKERLPRRVLLASPIVIFTAFILATGRALWVAGQ